MGKLSLTLIVVGTAACGGNNNTTVDAHVVVPDAKPIDAPKVFLDAPPVTYDFTCFGANAPTTATDPATISGNGGELGTGGLTNTDGIAISIYKTGVATALKTTVTAGGGLFTSGALVTGGTPIDWYIVGSIAQNRTTYLYPPNLLTKDITMVPVPLVSDTLFGFLEQGAQVNQDDTNNGLLLVVVSDCMLKPITGATLKVQQAGVDKGTQFDLGALSAMAAGTFAVFNVPDGATQVSASYNGMDFPARTVMAHKKPGNVNAEGTITSTAIAPGPF